MSDLPEPLTPEDCDLRDYTFMPLDIVRLFGSEFHAQSTDSEWRAGLTLWCKSFHQMPAASLPDDDVTLCRLAELGRDMKAWKKLKEGALRGWVKCSDGRLYHEVVAEKANDAWGKKKIQRERSRKGNEARWGKDKKDSPKGDEKLSHKESPKDSLDNPLTIPRDRDRDRDSNTSSLRSDEREGAPSSLAPAVDAADGQTDLEDFTGPATPKPKRAARLPDDWQPNAEDAEFSRSLGLTTERISAVFRDYWHAKSGKDATKTDWSATWRNWCRREQESVMTGGKVAVSGQRQPPQSAREIQRQNAESLADRMARRYGGGVSA